MKHALQAASAQAQVAHRHAHRVDLPVDLLTTPAAAARLQYTGPAAVKNFLKWADRHRVPRLHRGRTCLWQPSVLMAFLSREPWTLNRHGRTLRAVQGGSNPATVHGQANCSRRTR